MASRGRKEVICIDTINSLSFTDQIFQWSTMYERYMNLSMQEKNNAKI